MPIPTNTYTTLDAIKNNVRELTRSPGQEQLTDAQLLDHINYALTNNLPQEIRFFDLRRNYSFYTQPNIETYSTVAAPDEDPLYNFRNRFRTIHPPVYIGGVLASYTQKPDIFWGLYPQNSFIRDTQLRGNGTAGPYTGTLSQIPVMQNRVIFTSQDALGNGLTLVDYPIDNVAGDLDIPNANPLTLGGTINYITGAFSLTFSTNVAAGQPIYSQTLPYTPNIPISMLYYNDTFTLRPVPDKVYQVEFQVEARPTELLNGTDQPLIEEWTDYISALTAMRIFRYRNDSQSAQELLPFLKTEEMKVQRPTINQATNESTTTIYNLKSRYRWGGFWGPGWPY